MTPILVTTRLVESDHGEVRECLDVKWGRFLRACGITPIVGCLKSGIDSFSQIPLSGILFTGGNDLSSVSDNPLSSMRDAWESSLLAYAQRERLPVLGVCRGMQFLACQLGASLDRVTNHVSVRHRLTYSGNVDKPIFQSCGELSFVNSYHLWGVKSNMPGCDELLFSQEDNVVEAFAIHNKRLYGMMWHPEREENPVENDIHIFRRIFCE